MLSRELGNEAYYGRQHMHALLGMVAQHEGHRTFVDIARPFLLVIAHPALLDCLTVDTFVGGLYNFLRGSNGSLAIPFFERLTEALLEQHLDSHQSNSDIALGNTLITASVALRELLRRKQRTLFREYLQNLVASIEGLPETIGASPDVVMYQRVRNCIKEVHGMMACARALLQQDQEPQIGDVSTLVPISTYLRDVIIPHDRRNNDKADITTQCK